MRTESCIIFPHIPKCGGTSLMQQLRNANIEVFLDYDKPPHATSKYFQSNCERRNHESSLLDFCRFDLVFGHFPIKRYQHENYRYVVLLRDPLERALSHFFYWKNQLRESNLMAIHQYPIILDIKAGRVNFLKFVRTQKLSSFFWQYLGEKKPQDFVLVGFTDEYDDFASRLSCLLGIEINSDVHLRKGIKETVAANLLNEARKLLEPEIKLYEQFRDHWG